MDIKRGDSSCPLFLTLMKGVRIRMKFGNHNVIKTISNITRYLSVYTGEIWTPRDKWQIGWHNWKKYRRGGGRWLEGMIFKMEVETGENKSKKDIFWRGGAHWQIRSGGVLVRKKISRFEISRGWHL